MSDKLKLNFTPVPNVILDKVMRMLAPGATKLLFAICRYTYGWKKPEGERISLKQLEEMTGMSRWSVVRSLKQLSALVIITPGNANQASHYRLNVDISDADLGTICDQSQKVTSHLGSHLGVTFHRKSKERRNTGARAPDRASSISKNRKQSGADPAQLRAFDQFYQAYPRHVGRAEGEKAWLKLNPDPELATRIMAAVSCYANEVRDTEPKYIKHPGPWLNARRWEDEAPIGGNGTGHAKPAEVRDLGDGWLEVDGLKISQKDFDRRWKTASR